MGHLFIFMFLKMFFQLHFNFFARFLQTKFQAFKFLPEKQKFFKWDYFHNSRRMAFKKIVIWGNLFLLCEMQLQTFLW